MLLALLHIIGLHCILLTFIVYCPVCEGARATTLSNIEVETSEAVGWGDDEYELKYDEHKCTIRLTSALLRTHRFTGLVELSFLSEPTDTVVVRDRPVVLDCSVHFSSPDGSTQQSVDIQWLRDGAVLDLSNPRRQLLANGSLYMEGRSADDGWYQCRVNVAGVGVILSRKAHLQVSYIARSFTEEPKNTSAYLGDNVMLTCVIDGSPSPSVDWIKDDIDVSSTQTNYVFHDHGAILEIRSVQFTDFGRYRCKVTIIADRPRFSPFVTLSQNSDPSMYQNIPPRFVMQPSDQTVTEGATLVLYCAANGRDRNAARPRIVWLKDGITVDTGSQYGRLSVVGEGSLRVDGVLEEDAGLYTCRAFNTEDSIDAHAVVQVRVPPKLRQRPRSSTGVINSDKDIVCDVYSVPLPSIYWLKDGNIVSPNDYVQIINSRTLRILGLLPTDSGMYQCMATAGEAGSLQASAQLAVVNSAGPVSSAGSPSAPTDLTAPIVSLDFLTLSWKPPEDIGASEVTEYMIYWKEQSGERQRELNTTTIEANIQHLKSATKYTLQVYAVNSNGFSSSPAQIIVETQSEASVPDSPANVQATARSPTSMLVTWKSPTNVAADISGYSVYYYDVTLAENTETEVNVTGTSCILNDLKKFHQYSIRVVAFNNNGTGTSSQEVNCRTYSDVPSAMPQNVSVEALSSTSIIVRWEQPPDDTLNGIITGYKVRYRLGKERQQAVATVDSSQGQCSLTDLVRGAEYTIRVQAMTVNGTGPPTTWITAQTFLSDLDESTVPGEPTSLRVRPLTDSIVVSWTPPSTTDNNVMIRGYILGYGIGVPDVYRQILDAKQRYHTIRGLMSSSEYVISLKAFNNAGHGKPIYETTITREEKTPEPPTPIMPPVGLKATVLSPTTIVLTWTDTTLGRSQRVTDNRVYTVRYQPKSGGAAALSRKQKIVNATSLNVHVDDLKPDTEYEFSVRIVKGRRQSAWSLSIFNKTYEMVPTTSVRDLTPVSIEGRPTVISLNWQPPRQTNGQISGYQVFYTTDATLKDREWVREDVPGERLSVAIRGLSLETTYYFKVQARNTAGYGPMSSTVIFRTPRADGTNGGLIEMPDDYGRTNAPRQPAREHTDSRVGSTAVMVAGLSSTMLWIIISVIGGVTVIAVIIIVIIFTHRHCTKSTTQTAPPHKNVCYMPANKGKPATVELKPPDLWINYDHTAHRSLDRSDEVDEGTAMMSQNSHELDPSDIDNMDRYRRMLHCPKPVMIPVDHPQPPRDLTDHVVYPRTGQQIPSSIQPPYIGVPRVNAAQILSNPALSSSDQRTEYSRPGLSSGVSLGLKLPPDITIESRLQPACDTDRESSVSSPTNKVASPVEMTPGTTLTPTFSTEELSAEMANLEGLMKDLSAITQQQQEFDC